MKYISAPAFRAASLAIAITTLSLIITVNAYATGPTESTLYNFTGHPDGANPTSPVTFDKAGNMYLTTANGAMYGWGAVYELSPPATQGAAWTETNLYNFEAGSDGANPSSGVVFDKSGALYGEVFVGSVGWGDVYELTPAGAGLWNKSTAYLFCEDFSPCPDGRQPSGGLAFDASGNLYGTAAYGGAAYGCCGVVFKLTKSNSGWTQSVLYSFAGLSSGQNDGSTPLGGVVVDKEGNVYGTTLYGGDPSGCGGNGCGTVFKLSQEGGNWKETILYKFQGTGDGNGPQSGLVFDECGALYGTTSGEGVYNAGNVFKLSPPVHSGEPWKESVLYNFQGVIALDGAYPQAGVVFWGKNLYGTTANGGSALCSYGGSNAGCGTVFELAAPRSGTGIWKETILWNFSDSSNYPVAPLTVRNGALYGTTADGGSSTYSCPYGCGTVFEVIP